jgi:hypothetical protein
VSRDGLHRARDAAEQFARAAEQAALAGENRHAARLYKAALMMLLGGPSEAVCSATVASDGQVMPKRA